MIPNVGACAGAAIVIMTLENAVPQKSIIDVMFRGGGEGGGVGGGLTEGAFITMIHKDHELKI